MKLTAIKNIVTSKVGRQLLLAQKHSPVLLFGAGVVGVVATAVMASRATLKIDDILNDHDDTMEKIESFEHADYTDQARQKDKVLLYCNTGLRLARVYAPAVFIGGVSIAALTGSHVILTKRQAAIGAAYAVLDRSFRSYRERVVKELGVDKEREFLYDTDERQVVVSTEDGPVTKTLKHRKTSISPYARIFDEGNRNWVGNYNYNQMFISCQQKWANDLLHARGHVFLNEVYDMLGMERSREGAVVGWIRGHGDDYIDFGVFDDDIHAGLLFVNGDEPSVILDFNVDGIIWDKI